MADPWKLPLLDFSVAADAREEPHVRFTGATAECARSQGWQAPGTTGWLEDFGGCGDERSLVLRISEGRISTSSCSKYTAAALLRTARRRG